MRFSALAAQLQGFAHSTILACRAESASVADSAVNADVGVSLVGWVGVTKHMQEHAGL